MAVAYTTTDFINSVRLRGSIPATTNTSNVNNTTNLLQLATEELLIKLAPMIMAVREDFYVNHQDVTITQGIANYPLPERAMGQIIRDLHIIQGSSIIRLQPLQPEYIVTTAQGDVLGYYFENNNIVLYPTPGSSSLGTLRIRYFQRPGQLLATASCGQITAINSGTNTVTVSSVPSSWTVGTSLDFCRATPPYDNQAIDQPITALSGTNITFAALPKDASGNLLIAVNDWLAPAEYTPIPQVPREFQAILAQMTVVKVLQAQGDLQGAAQAMKDLELMQQSALSLISNRDEGSGKKVVSRNWFRR